MLKIKITYPSKEEELKIMRMYTNDISENINAVVSKEDIIRARKVVKDIYIDEKVEKYILDIVFATRNPAEYGLSELTDLISYGASPRATLNLANGAKSMAFIKRRGYVVPEDVRSICADVMRHRIAVTYEAEAQEINSDAIIQKILNKVEVP
jgi:MoxR-like ATPase